MKIGTKGNTDNVLDLRIFLRYGVNVVKDRVVNNYDTRYVETGVIIIVNFYNLVPHWYIYVQKRSVTVAKCVGSTNLSLKL